MDPLHGRILIFIRTGNTSREANYKRLVEVGSKIVFVHPMKNWAEPYAWRWVLTDTYDIPPMIESVKEAMLQGWSHEERSAISAVLTYDEYGVLPAAILGGALKVPVCPSSPEVVRLTHIKSDFRQWCGQVGLRCPRSKRLFEEKDLDEKALANICSYPVVVKPSPGAGSSLVTLCKDEKELKEATHHVFQVLRSNPDAHLWCTLGTTLHVLIEEYISGLEADIDCLVQNGELKYAWVSENFETTKLDLN